MVVLMNIELIDDALRTSARPSSPFLLLFDRPDRFKLLKSWGSSLCSYTLTGAVSIIFFFILIITT